MKTLKSIHQLLCNGTSIKPGRKIFYQSLQNHLRKTETKN
jgi:hypothetical protein